MLGWSKFTKRRPCIELLSTHPQGICCQIRDLLQSPRTSCKERKIHK